MELIFFFSLFLFSLATSQYRGCPPFPLDPCTCLSNPHPFLDCEKVDEIELLRDVFSISAKYSFQVVRISNSVLQFLPHEIFDKVGVSELQLYNVTLVQMFDETPKNIKSLRTLHIESTHIFRGILWEHLETMENLKILNVYMNRIEVIDDDFVNYVPKTLQQVSLYDTKTSRIQPAAFSRFVNLDKIAIDHGELSELKRNMFPDPFNGRVLYFNENQLRILPADLFTNMPNIQTIGLRGNSIASFPVTMFQTRFPKLDYLMLDECPQDDIDIGYTFYCGEDDACIPPSWVCDNYDDCDDERDERYCVNHTCDEDDDFRCDVGQCVDIYDRCDGYPDCRDSTDEKNCTASNCDGFFCAYEKICIAYHMRLNGKRDCEDRSDEDDCEDDECEYMKCDGDKFIASKFKCDGYRDCVDGTDESICETETCTEEQFKCRDYNCISRNWVCDGEKECKDGSDEVECDKKICNYDTEFRCASGQCVTKDEVCNGVNDCKDLTDEKNCTLENCRGFFCDTGRCFSHAFRCDRDEDCDDGSDEMGCHLLECEIESYFRCDIYRCLPPSYVCDDQSDCEDETDENNCDDDADLALKEEKLEKLKNLRIQLLNML